VTSFDADTAVTRIAEHVYRGEISPTWSIGRGPNGGYLAALLLRALQMVAGEGVDPRSLTLHYLAPPDIGPCEVAVTIERSGRTMSMLSARLSQGARLCVIALAVFSRPRAGLEIVEERMPDAPLPTDTTPVPAGMGPPFWQNYEVRMAYGALPFSGAETLRSGGWLRLREPRMADPLFFAALTDAWFPQIFTRLSAPVPAPTIDLTIHFRAHLPLASARPDDWYLLAVSTRLATEGFFEEDTEVWSRDGRLLAQSRQLALAPDRAADRAGSSADNGTNG
jgi:acyl-CoA thioesterase